MWLKYFEAYRNIVVELGEPVMAKSNPFEFIQEVRSEISKVSWPTRKETWITTVMVVIMVFISAIFFLLIDQVLSGAVKFILGLGG